MSTTTGPVAGDRSQAAEDFPLTPVPMDARKPIWSLAPLLMGFALTSTTLFAGGAIGPAFPFIQMLLIVLIGNLLLGAYCSALGFIAQRSGLPTVLMSRFSFGNMGSRWVDFILGFTQIGWYAVTNAFIASALTELLGLPIWFNVVGTIFFTYAFCVTAYVGYNAMDWLSRLAVPAMLILIAISLTLGFRDAGDLASLQPTAEMTFTQALAVVIGTFISGGTQATNWSRFADTGKNAVWSTALSFFFINGLLVFAGAFCTLVYGSEDLIQAMATQGILAGGIVLLILNVWTTQDNTIYNFSMAGTNFFRTTKRHAFVLGGATLALALALSGGADRIIPFLLFLGVVIPPVGGIIMADFWFRHRGQFPSLDTNLPAFNWAGVIAYVVAALTAYFTSQTGIGVGPINGVIIAAVSYAILTKVIPQPIRDTSM
ncbi:MULTISPECIES: cytosine permease [unclassified Leptolyngbya]|uniref:cytosine permease n=1 Tax=unclassified Leptolyngbya TaxID=2650499 RepID=UPI00168699B5|nr:MULTISPECIES: cytosine permease [unclassified Leptolyngbya]MBD1909951.1 cytosine permease [Leptolyngbya sp. FACHB-8]MBD2159056.1 cytosine permease [Leptolyngbya sp. FACHB-16]